MLGLEHLFPFGQFSPHEKNHTQKEHHGRDYQDKDYHRQGHHKGSQKHRSPEDFEIPGDYEGHKDYDEPRDYREPKDSRIPEHHEKHRHHKKNRHHNRTQDYSNDSQFSEISPNQPTESSNGDSDDNIPSRRQKKPHPHGNSHKSNDAPGSRAAVLLEEALENEVSITTCQSGLKNA